MCVQVLTSESDELSDSFTREDFTSSKSLSADTFSDIFSSCSPSSLKDIISSLAPRSSPPPPFSCGIVEEQCGVDSRGNNNHKNTFFFLDRLVQTRRRSSQLQRSVHVSKLLFHPLNWIPWSMTRVAIIIHSFKVSTETLIENNDGCLASAAGCAATWQSFASFAACGQLVAPVCVSPCCAAEEWHSLLLEQSPGTT